MHLSLRPSVALLALWGFATAATLAVAHFSRVGPVLLVLTYGHGVHEGDLMAGLLFLGLALVGSIAILRTERGSHG